MLRCCLWRIPVTRLHILTQPCGVLLIHCIHPNTAMVRLCRHRRAPWQPPPILHSHCHDNDPQQRDLTVWCWYGASSKSIFTEDSSHCGNSFNRNTLHVNMSRLIVSVQCCLHCFINTLSLNCLIELKPPCRCPPPYFHHPPKKNPPKNDTAYLWRF